MTFARTPAAGKPRARPRRIPTALILRSLAMGTIAIVGAAGALVRHCTHELPPMRIPTAPRTSPTYDADAGELPVPELVDLEGGPL